MSSQQNRLAVMGHLFLSAPGSAAMVYQRRAAMAVPILRGLAESMVA